MAEVQREVVRKMATFYNQTDEDVVVKIHEIPGHGAVSFRCRARDTVEGPASYTEPFRRESGGALVPFVDQQIGVQSRAKAAPAAEGDDGKAKGGKSKAAPAAEGDEPLGIGPAIGRK